MRLNVSPHAVVMLAGFALFFAPPEAVATGKSAGESGKALLTVKQVGTVRVEGKQYVPITYRYSGDDFLEEVEIRLYVYLQKAEKRAVAKGSLKVESVGKGTHEVTGHVPENCVEEYGTVRKKRVEVWYNDKLQAELTEPKPQPGDKWWDEEEKVPGEGESGDKKTVTLEVLDTDIRSIKGEADDDGWQRGKYRKFKSGGGGRGAGH